MEQVFETHFYLYSVSIGPLKAEFSIHFFSMIAFSLLWTLLFYPPVILMKCIFYQRSWYSFRKCHTTIKGNTFYRIWSPLEKRTRLTFDYISKRRKREGQNWMSLGKNENAFASRQQINSWSTNLSSDPHRKKILWRETFLLLSLFKIRILLETTMHRL